MSSDDTIGRDPHLKMIRPVTPSAEGCEDCLRIGSTWLHLRLCLTCGHVGCCDSSPNRHARHHNRKSTRLNSSHGYISYAVFCLKKKKKYKESQYKPT